MFSFKRSCLSLTKQCMAQYASLKNIAFPYCVVRLLQIETENDTVFIFGKHIIAYTLQYKQDYQNVYHYVEIHCCIVGKRYFD